MTFVAVPTVVRARFMIQSANFSGGFRLFFGYGTQTPPSAQNCVSLAGVMASAWQNDLAPVTHPNLSLVSVTVQDIGSDSGQAGTQVVNYPGTNTSLGNAPASLCALIVHTINRHYRGGKPRTYLPGPCDGDLQDARHLTPTYQGNVQAGWGQFINAINAGSAPIVQLNHVSVSYKQGHMANPTPTTWGPINVPAPRPGGPKVDGIISHSVSQTPGQQRRRLRAG